MFFSPKLNLSIFDAARFLVNSSNAAATIIARRQALDNREDSKLQSSLFSSVGLLLGASSSIAGLLALANKFKSDLSSSEPKVSEELDKLKQIASSSSLPESSTTTAPQAPAIVTTESGKAFVAPQEASSVKDAINNAATVVGVDPALLFSVAKVESSFDGNALNPITNATGLFQIVPSTWNYLIAKYPNFGFTAKDISDPFKNAIVGAVYIKQVSNTLEKALGRTPTPTEIYLGHFLGPTGSIKFIRLLASSPKATAADYFKSAAKANKNIFYNKDVPLTVAEVYQKMFSKVGTVYNTYAGLKAGSDTPVSVAGATPDVKSNGSSMKAATAQSTPIEQSVNPAAMIDSSILKSASYKEPTINTPPTAPLPVSSKKDPEVDYVRDRKGRLVTIAH